jgi:hypothetical protein
MARKRAILANPEVTVHRAIVLELKRSKQYYRSAPKIPN